MPKRTSAGRLAGAAFALSFACAAAYAVHIALGDKADSLVWDYLVYHGSLGLASLACFFESVAERRLRGAWIGFGLGILAWTAGDLYWELALSDLKVYPYPSLADAGYLAVYPCFYAGTVLLIRHRVGRFTLARWLDGLIGALAAAALATALIAPALVGLTRGDPAAVLTNLAYPLGDLGLIALIAGTLVVAGTRGARALLLIGAGLAVWAVADVSYLLQAATSSYNGGWIDEGWLVGVVVIAAGAAVTGGPGLPLRQRARAAYHPSILAPASFGAVAVGVLAWDHFNRLHPSSIWLAVATLAAVVLRLGLSFGENSRLLAALHEDSTTDALTGLGNRRQLFADLEQALSSPSRPHLFALYDLDGFKAYNDDFGHAAGDALLARLGGRLAAALPPGARAYRLGGDEFCFLCPLDGNRPAAVLAGARAALSERGEGFAISASAGAVTTPEDADAATEVLRIADQRMYAEKERAPGRLALHRRELLRSLVRDGGPELERHHYDVAELALDVGRALGLAGEDLDVLARAAEFHDLGKLAIPDEILNKPGPLDAGEWDLMRKHPLVGARLLGRSPALEPVARLVRSSHERWDGNGYPDGLASEEIPLGSRIILACDAFCVMTRGRPYQPAMPVAEALAELRENAGTQFDPTVAELLARRIEAGLAGGSGVERIGELDVLAGHGDERP